MPSNQNIPNIIAGVLSATLMMYVKYDPIWGTVATLGVYVIANNWKKNIKPVIQNWIHGHSNKNPVVKWINKTFKLKDDTLKKVMLKALCWTDDVMDALNTKLKVNILGETAKNVYEILTKWISPDEAFALGLVSENGSVVSTPVTVFNQKEVLEMTI